MQGTLDWVALRVCVWCAGNIGLCGPESICVGRKKDYVVEPRECVWDERSFNASVGGDLSTEKFRVDFDEGMFL